MRSKFGFTLIELMIVIAIVGLLTTVSTAKYGDFLQRQKVEKALHQIKYDIVFLQNQKYRSPNEHFYIEFINDGYKLYDREKQDSGTETLLKDPLNKQAMEYNFGENNTKEAFKNVTLDSVKIDGTENNGPFYMDRFGGLLVKNGTWEEIEAQIEITIKHTNNSDEEMTLKIDPLSSEMEIK